MGANRRTVQQTSAKPVHSDTPEIEELARQVADLQRVFNPFASGVILDFHVMGPGSQTLKHGLGRVPQGFMLLNLNFPSSGGTWCGNGWDSQVFYLYSSVEATGRVLVF